MIPLRNTASLFASPFASHFASYLRACFNHGLTVCGEVRFWPNRRAETLAEPRSRGRLRHIGHGLLIAVACVLAGFAPAELASAGPACATPAVAPLPSAGWFCPPAVIGADILAAGKIHWTDTLRDYFRDYKLDDPWILFGFAAQAVFASRFMVQWIASERAGRSIVPTIFWYLSLLGTTMLAVYALHRKDIVFILGQTLNIFIYVRNLMLIYRPKRPAAAQA